MDNESNCDESTNSPEDYSTSSVDSDCTVISESDEASASDDSESDVSESEDSESENSESGDSDCDDFGDQPMTDPDSAETESYFDSDNYDTN